MKVLVLENIAVACGVYRMVLQGEVGHVLPGQFLNLTVPGYYLRRPFAIADKQDDTLTIYYKIAGQGTEQMTSFAKDCQVDILAPLGNGFSSFSGEHALLIGGGAGVAPLYGLAKSLRRAGKRVTVALGFAGAADAYLTAEFDALGCAVFCTSVDGTLGTKGMVTEVLPHDADYFYACGPTPMLKAASERLTTTPGEVSLEERMACGFGACVGCAVRTTAGMQRVCKDGPVFSKEVVVW